MARSVATIDSPEFINVQPYSPLISQCEIKVLYVGENRNRSFISKEVATEMANSLPGCPIVGYYRNEKEDFGDHGQKITIDGDGVRFETLTKPYGFVAPDAKVWFQKFEDTDDFGNTVIREYLMTNGYLWTGQFEEVQRVIDKGNNQSMEIDEKTLKGKWATNNNTGIEFFIINDAIFSKLAILGEDVEPCFEGAEITAPKVSSSFSLDDEFKHTLFSMMDQLKSALRLNEGGLNVYMRTKKQLMDENVMPSDMTQEEKDLFTPEEMKQMMADERDAKKKATKASLEDGTREFADLSEDERALFDADELAAYEVVDTPEDEEPEVPVEEPEIPVEEPEVPVEEPEVPEPTVEEQFALLSVELEDLKTKFAALETEAEGLRSFKAEIVDKQKDTLIKSFYMLSDEDKAEVVANKAQYSLDEIESKLSVICVRNKVSFDKNDDTTDDGVDSPAVTFTLDGDIDTPPAFVRVLREVKRTRN